MLKNPNYVYGPQSTNVPLHLNFGQFILEKMSRHQDKIAMINGATGEKIAYKDIVQVSMRFAISLSQLGVRKGEIVAVLSENRHEYWPAVIGPVCVGATVTTISYMYAEAELKHVFNLSKPKYLIISPKSYEKHQHILKSFHYIEKTILFGDAEPNSKLYSFNEITNTEINWENFRTVDVRGQEDILFILYSSGTTGLPKAVCLTHMNVIGACCVPPLLDPELKVINIRSWYHVSGLLTAIFSITVGRLEIFLDGFNLDLYLKTIENYKVDQLVLAPSILVAICKDDIKYDLSSVVYIFAATSPLQKNTINATYHKFPKLKGIIQGYGSSETTMTYINYSYSDLDVVKHGSVGFLSPDCQVKVIDIKSRQPLGPNQQGEVCVKSPFLMKGYLGRARSEDFDDEDFYRTGDVGYYDEDEHFYIVDRIKELIKYFGFQVGPAEVESVLLQHAAVRDAGVIGIKDDAAGEIPLAFVVLQPGRSVTEEEIKDYISRQLSDPKHLRGGVRFVNAIPRNSNGKILRRELRKLFEGNIFVE